MSGVLDYIHLDLWVHQEPTLMVGIGTVFLSQSTTQEEFGFSYSNTEVENQTGEKLKNFRIDGIEYCADVFTEFRKSEGI